MYIYIYIYIFFFKNRKMFMVQIPFPPTIRLLKKLTYTYSNKKNKMSHRWLWAMLQRTKTHHSKSRYESLTTNWSNCKMGKVNARKVNLKNQCWGEKFRPLNEMLGNQTETQLWALEMTPIGFRCDNKPIQARRNKNCT